MNDGELRIDCPPTWRPGAQLVIVGEAPGADEVRLGEGFVGRAGKLLDRLLGVAGLDRAQISLTNVVQRALPFNDFSILYDKKKPKEELVAWRALLQEQLVEHRPAVAVACGNEALDALLGMRQISARRGSAWRRDDGLWVVALLHPSAILRGAQWQEIPIAGQILRRAARLAATPEYTPRGHSIEIGDGSTLAAWLSRELRFCTYWSLDLETIPGKSINGGTITVLGLAALHPNGETAAHVMAWPVGDVWECLRDAIERRSNRLVGHHLLYDRAWLESVGAWPVDAAPAMDTMQRWRGLFAELPKSLAFCAMWAFGEDLPYWKDEGKKLHTEKTKTPDQQAQYLVYCAKDCVATVWLAEWLDQEAARRHWAPPSWESSNWRVAGEMQRRGVLLDREGVSSVAEAVDAATQQVDEALASLAPELNPNSPRQVSTLLYETLQLPKQYKGQTATTDLEALKQLRRSHVLPILDALLQYRKLEKLASSYITPLTQAVLNGGVLRCGWTPDATETWRFSSATHPRGGGLNLQTMPQSLRWLVQAPPGRVFVQPDLAQAEARYVAWRARCQSLMALFNDATRSIHLERARAIYGREITKADALEYRRAKSAVHAANYREGPLRLSQQLTISLAEAKQLLKQAWLAEIERWHHEVKRLALGGVLANCWGQERVCYTALGMKIATGSLGDHEWKSLIAWEPQSAIPQIINQAILSLSQDSTLWWHVHGHDSFLVSVALEELDAVAARIETSLALACPVAESLLRIPVDLQVGFTWGQMTHYDSAWRERLDALPPPDPRGAIERAFADIEIIQEGEDL